jgi:choline-sulfatase
VGPEVAKQKTIDEAIYLQDVMPTTLELAGVRQPEHVEFNSLLPMLSGGSSPYKSIYGCYLAKQRSIRTDKYKLIAYPEAKVLRLYDMRADPAEKHDLAGEATMKPVLADLFNRLIALQVKMNDDLDLHALAPD